MKANYHTHTWRCHHAEGTEREYIEKAIEAGMEILGFSDHAPYPYPEGYVADYKMLPSGLEDYVNTILDLKREYRDQIDIRLGMEAEYYPAMWERFLSLVEPYPIEYLLLGQHFLGNEYDDPVYCARETGSEKKASQILCTVYGSVGDGKIRVSCASRSDQLYRRRPGL